MYQEAWWYLRNMVRNRNKKILQKCSQKFQIQIQVQVQVQVQSSVETSFIKVLWKWSKSAPNALKVQDLRSLWSCFPYSPLFGTVHAVMDRACTALCTVHCVKSPSAKNRHGPSQFWTVHGPFMDRARTIQTKIGPLMDRAWTVHTGSLWVCTVQSTVHARSTFSRGAWTVPGARSKIGSCMDRALDRAPWR